MNEIKNTASDAKKDSAANDKIINIALFGIDAGNNESGRSDSIIILTVDPVHNKIKVASIMRDSYVEIPGYGQDKINHAFAFGGSTLALNTINTNFGLAIDKFVATNFTDMPLIIDNLGGVELNITDEELPHLQSCGVTSTGVQTLNGEQALAYSRIRYTSGNDFERTSRHRTILGAIYRKLMTVSVSQYPSLLLDFLPLVETNMSNTELLSLGTTINKINGSELIEDRFPRDGFWQDAKIEGIYYLSFELEPTKRQLQRFIYEN
ncbi:MAG: LCP family protein [Clostridium sp.]